MREYQYCAHQSAVECAAALQGLNFTGIVVRTPAVPGEELCVCGGNRVCESQDCRTVVYPIRQVICILRISTSTPACS